MFAGPNSYSLKCMMEGNDMHVKALISPWSLFDRITTNPNFSIHIHRRLNAAMIGSGIRAHTARHTSDSIEDQSLNPDSCHVALSLSYDVPLPTLRSSDFM